MGRKEEPGLGGEVLEKPEQKTAKPRLFNVILHNDDYTTMEFVVHVPQSVFQKPEPDAFRIMMQVHLSGRGLCGAYPFDIAETKAVKATFGPQARKVAISSTKSQLGHLLGASGGVEAVVTAMSVWRNLIPPTINLTDPDPECDLDYTPHRARDLKVTYAMSNSFGFGGHNASLLIKKV